jgi:dTDP-glucose 4,6-dehydratase
MSEFKHNPKRIFVTGGCGFIGSHFINHYFDANPECQIINFDAMYYCASQTNVREDIRNSDRYVLIMGKLQSYDIVYDALAWYEIDTIIHFAAQSHVQNSFEHSLQYTEDNVFGTHALLEAARKYGKIERFIHISTDEVYGESMLDGDSKKTEESVLCPTNPYAATKAAAELIVQSYYHSFKMPIIITRGNNVYGPNQYPEKLIPRFLKLLLSGNAVTIQGDGSNKRAFLHVADVCNALHCVLEKGVLGEIYNVGADDSQEYSVLDIANMLIDMVHPLIDEEEDRAKWITYVEDRPFNDKRYYISNEKVKSLGWEINVDFKSGLAGLLC